MVYTNLKKILILISLFLLIMIGQSFTPASAGDKEKESGLKVLPKNISEEELVKIMKDYSKSLGVKCSHCHAPQKDDPSKLNFASDAKPEKEIARKMIVMVNKINHKYISKIGDGGLESVACVTCHMGKVKPVVSVDSLVTNNTLLL